jgi:hypothetical protein
MSRIQKRVTVVSSDPWPMPSLADVTGFFLQVEDTAISQPSTSEPLPSISTNDEHWTSYPMVILRFVFAS